MDLEQADMSALWHTPFGGQGRRNWAFAVHKWVRASQAALDKEKDLPPFPISMYITNVMDVVGRPGTLMAVKSCVSRASRRLGQDADMRTEEMLVETAMLAVDTACSTLLSVSAAS